MTCSIQTYERDCPLLGRAPPAAVPVLALGRVRDFAVSGTGDAKQWSTTAWTEMRALGGDPSAYQTRFKAAYGDDGIYFLFECEDRRLTTTHYPQQGGEVWKGDSIELFLWPHEEVPVYFQYAISPLGAELPLMVPNNGISFVGWSPWHYEGARKIRARTKIDGPREPNASVRGWIVELCIPYRLLTGLIREVPGPGTIWRGNVYRNDYDGGEPTRWAWCDRTGSATHDFEKYGAFTFSR